MRRLAVWVPLASLRRQVIPATFAGAYVSCRVLDKSGRAMVGMVRSRYPCPATRRKSTTPLSARPIGRGDQSPAVRTRSTTPVCALGALAPRTPGPAPAVPWRPFDSLIPGIETPHAAYLSCPGRRQYDTRHDHAGPSVSDALERGPTLRLSAKVFCSKRAESAARGSTLRTQSMKLVMQVKSHTHRLLPFPCVAAAAGLAA